jgi:hypothetical protein
LNSHIFPKKRVAGGTGHELSSEEELMAQFSTVRSRRKQKKSLNDGVKQSSNKNQNTNKSQNHNQVKERIEQGLIQHVESEAQNLESEGTSNGREQLGEIFKSNEKGKFNDLRLKMYEKGPINIHLQVKRPDIPLVEGKNGKEVGILWYLQYYG